MLLRITFYVIATVLTIVVVLRIAQHKGKITLADALSALGIVVAIIIALNVPQPLVPAASPDQPPTITADGLLVFDEDFEDGMDDGFFYESGNWAIVDESGQNKALEASQSNVWSSARFGPESFSNGVIEYRVKVVEYNSSQHSGLAYLAFRELSDGRYIFTFDPQFSNAHLSYQGDDTFGEWVSFDTGSASLNPEKNLWHTVRLIVSGTNITIYIDQRLAIETEDVRLRIGQIKFGTAGFNTTVQFDDVRVWIAE